MKIGLCGLGKAGRQLVEYSLDFDQYDLAAVICRNESETSGKSVTEITCLKTYRNIIIQKIDDFTNKENLDVIIDFSGKETSLQLVDLCCKFGINLVICPNNFTEKELAHISNMSLNNKIGIMYAPTLTVGINAIITFVKMFSSVLPDFSFQIIEKHGKFKQSPTKTASIIADSIENKEVPISSIRLDGYVGEHEIIATNGNERISFVHESFSRNAFADGALLAAKFIYGKVGFFDIKEMFTEMMKK